MQQQRYRGIRKRSKKTLFGLPLVDVAVGPDPEKGEMRGHAKGIIALGDTARGWIAVGGAAAGIVALGGISIGLVSFGGLSLGVLALGGLAVGGIAVGGGAIGYYAFGAYKTLLNFILTNQGEASIKKGYKFRSRTTALLIMLFRNVLLSRLSRILIGISRETFQPGVCSQL